MSCFILLVCFLLGAQNAYAQVVLGGGKLGTNNFGSTVTGNSVVSNNIAINNANNVASLASNIGNSVLSSVGSNLASGGSTFGGNSAIASSIGLSLANNAAASNLAVANTAASKVGGAGVAVGNFGGVGASNLVANKGSQGITLGGLSNVKFGEIEYVKEVNGYSGEYPVIGYVTFEGYLPASGTVSVANDGCGCT